MAVKISTTPETYGSRSVPFVIPLARSTADFQHMQGMLARNVFELRRRKWEAVSMAPWGTWTGDLSTKGEFFVGDEAVGSDLDFAYELEKYGPKLTKLLKGLDRVATGWKCWVTDCRFLVREEEEGSGEDAIIERALHALDLDTLFDLCEIKFHLSEMYSEVLNVRRGSKIDTAKLADTFVHFCEDVLNIDRALDTVLTAWFMLEGYIATIPRYVKVAGQPKQSYTSVYGGKVLDTGKWEIWMSGGFSPFDNPNMLKLWNKGVISFGSSEDVLYAWNVILLY